MDFPSDLSLGPMGPLNRYGKDFWLTGLQRWRYCNNFWLMGLKCYCANPFGTVPIHIGSEMDPGKISQDRDLGMYSPDLDQDNNSSDSNQDMMTR